jgi:lipopolysaccharide export LptBFGC system permease protein LptF
MNYLFFLPLFVYFRNYKIFIDGIFNPEFYAKLLAPRDDIYHYLNRIVLLMLVALSALNIYWLIPVVKATYKKISHLFKGKSDKCIKKEDKQDKQDNKNKKSEVDAFVKEIDVDSDDDGDEEEEEQEKKEDVTNKKEEEIKEEVSNKKEEEIKEDVSNKKEEEVKI